MSSYCIISMSKYIGIMEWVDNTNTLFRNIIYKRHNRKILQKRLNQI